MISRRDAVTAEARRLREAIGADIRALRQTFGRGAPSQGMSTGDLGGEITRLLRANPTWAAALAAGALAGLWTAARNRLRRPPQSGQSAAIDESAVGSQQPR